MHDIKFRAFSKELKTWYYSDDEAYVLKDIDGKLFLMEMDNFYNNKDVELSIIDEAFQFTGITDKNKKEIYYDCDIFKFKWMTGIREYDELIGIMTFNDEELRAEVGIYPESNEGRYVCLDYIGNGQMFDFEVIGDKYQNQELLE